MKRKLSLIEGTMYAGGKTAVNVVSSVTVKGTIKESDLHAALLKIQTRHPLLSANVWEDEARISYFVKQNPIQKISVRIVNRQASNDWEKESITECLAPFDTSGGTLFRLAWIKDADVSDLIFVAHHCICDGRSILNLMDETLTLLGQPEKELGTYESFSSIQNFIPTEIRDNKANKLKVRLFSKVAKVVLLLVAFKKEIKREKPFFMHWRLSKEESLLIAEKCKSKGVSVHDALSVAFLRGFKDIETIKSNSRLYCAVDMRKFLPDVKNDMLFAFPAMVGLDLPKKKTTDFWSQAKAFKDELSKKIDEMNVNTVLLYSECLLPSLPRMTQYAKADKGTHDFTLSNMGKVSISERYNDLEVESLQSPSTIFPFGNPTTLFTTFFKGQIDFIFTSDEYFIQHTDAQTLKENAMLMMLN
ncbi:condensation domain-containing protein [Pedobacter foliorum]|uniref:condensation domain-containing protein n=1 Tax=Pedobacter foliorum TaxID=2739058 RepID=UPI0015665F2D|nr:condensation domain-containing protein [Pedobacter foliorum]NRF38904.1 hypothetical protein [Pedobacter foliorum]